MDWRHYLLITGNLAITSAALTMAWQAKAAQAAASSRLAALESGSGEVDPVKFRKLWTFAERLVDEHKKINARAESLDKNLDWLSVCLAQKGITWHPLSE